MTKTKPQKKPDLNYLFRWAMRNNLLLDVTCKRARVYKCHDGSDGCWHGITEEKTLYQALLKARKEMGRDR